MNFIGLGMAVGYERSLTAELEPKRTIETDVNRFAYGLTAQADQKIQQH